MAVLYCVLFLQTLKIITEFQWDRESQDFAEAYMEFKEVSESFWEWPKNEKRTKEPENVEMWKF